MSSVTTTESAAFSDEIISDKHALQMKHKIMDKLKWNALLGSISESSKFVAGPLLSVGLVIATTASLATAAPLLIAAATFLVGGVAAGFASTRIFQSGQFDNFELNAESTARHLVKELQTSRTSIIEEHSQNVRADGKKWVQVTNKENVAIAQS